MSETPTTRGGKGAGKGSLPSARPTSRQARPAHAQHRHHYKPPATPSPPRRTGSPRAPRAAAAAARPACAAAPPAAARAARAGTLTTPGSDRGKSCVGLWGVSPRDGYLAQSTTQGTQENLPTAAVARASRSGLDCRHFRKVHTSRCGQGGQVFLSSLSYSLSELRRAFCVAS